MIKSVLRSLNTKFSALLVSLILGLGLASIFRRTCDNKECLTFHGPPNSEIVDHIYKYDDKCYKFNEQSVSCNNSQKTIINYK